MKRNVERRGCPCAAGCDLCRRRPPPRALFMEAVLARRVASALNERSPGPMTTCDDYYTIRSRLLVTVRQFSVSRALRRANGFPLQISLHS